MSKKKSTAPTDRTVFYGIVYLLPKKEAENLLYRYSEEKVFVAAFCRCIEDQIEIATTFEQAVEEAVKEALSETLAAYY